MHESSLNQLIRTTKPVTLPNFTHRLKPTQHPCHSGKPSQNKYELDMFHPDNLPEMQRFTFGCCSSGFWSVGAPETSATDAQTGILRCRVFIKAFHYSGDKSYCFRSHQRYFGKLVIHTVAPTSFYSIIQK